MTWGSICWPLSSMVIIDGLQNWRGNWDLNIYSRKYDSCLQPSDIEILFFHLLKDPSFKFVENLVAAKYQHITCNNGLKCTMYCTCKY